MTNDSKPDPPDLSRRSFLKGAGGAAAAGSLISAELKAAREQEAIEAAKILEGRLEVQLEINGELSSVQVEPRTTLLSALRDRMGLTGTKLVCDHGSCGACTVLVDGKPVYSCMQLAVRSEGTSIRTVEGLGTPDALSPLQQAFCDKDGSMCGFCTPGFLLSLTGAIEEKGGALTEEEIKQSCSGNFCRCGTYPFLFEAAEQAAQAYKSTQEGGK